MTGSRRVQQHHRHHHDGDLPPTTGTRNSNNTETHQRSIGRRRVHLVSRQTYRSGCTPSFNGSGSSSPSNGCRRYRRRRAGWMWRLLEGAATFGRPSGRRPGASSTLREGTTGSRSTPTSIVTHPSPKPLSPPYTWRTVGGWMQAMSKGHHGQTPGHTKHLRTEPRTRFLDLDPPGRSSAKS